MDKYSTVEAYFMVNKHTQHSNMKNAPKGIGLAYDTFEESYL